MTSRARRSTRRRLLDAAGKTFAEKRFRDATVRQICHRAGVNVAAVNYHFGDKRALYEQVILDAVNYAMEEHPPVPNDDGAPPEERLYVFVRSFLMRRLDPKRPLWHRRLIIREMAEPSPALRNLIGRAIRQNRTILCTILSDLAGPAIETERLDLCLGVVLGQCLYWAGRRMGLRQDAPPRPETAADIERLARQVTELALAAIGRRGARRRTGGAPRRGPRP